MLKITQRAARSLFSLLSFTIFFSSTGLLIRKHFCQNELQSASLFKAKSCHSDESHHCNATKKKCCQIKNSEEKDKCCHNQSEYVKLDLNQYYFNYYFKDKKVDFVKLSKYHYQQVLPYLQNKRLKFFQYKPPLTEFDLQ